MSVPVSVVAVLLIVWEPLNLAIRGLQVLRTLAYRGWLPVLELTLHAAIAALAVAAGIMLLNRNPDARRIARIAIILSAARVVQSIYWSALPNDTPPGDEWMHAGAAILAATAALIMLRQRMLVE